MPVETVLPSVLQFYDNVYARTDYDNKTDADAVWSKLRADLPGNARSHQPEMPIHTNPFHTRKHRAFKITAFLHATQWPKMLRAAVTSFRTKLWAIPCFPQAAVQSCLHDPLSPCPISLGLEPWSLIADVRFCRNHKVRGRLCSTLRSKSQT